MPIKKAPRRPWKPNTKKERGYNTVIHHRTNLLCHTNIPCLLKELPNSTLLRCLACIDKTSRNFNDDLVDRGSVLLLQKYFWAGLFVQDCDNTDAVEFYAGRTGLRVQNVVSIGTRK